MPHSHSPSHSHPHFVVSCKPGWSHLRTLCVLASKIALARPIVITCLIVNIAAIADKVAAEVARCLEEEDAPKGEVRFGVSSSYQSDGTLKLKSTFRSIWDLLINELPVKCASSGAKYPAAARPSLVILDGFQISWLSAIRSAQSPPPIMQWMMGFSGGYLSIVGPKEMGGRGDYFRAFDEENLSSSRELDYDIKGSVICIPGMPPMYDWEFFPQDLSQQRKKVLAAEMTLSKFINEADGLLTSCALDYDGEDCLKTMSAWIKQINDRPTFHLGPMMPFKPGTTEFSEASLDAEIAAAASRIPGQVSRYLNQAYEQYGESSVIYISFGTEHWPSTTSHLCILLSSLERRGIPFLLAHACPKSKIPDDMRERFKDSTFAFLTPWAPQQAVLAHKACGWFVTHGGANGTMEAVSQGVPMIGWPFAVDQPMNIKRLVHDLDVAFELMEVRTGALGLKPIFTTGKTPLGTAEAFEKELNGILDALEGEAGARKRANVQKIRKRLAEAWGKTGEARRAFEQFLDHFGNPCRA